MPRKARMTVGSYNQFDRQWSGILTSSYDGPITASFLKNKRLTQCGSGVELYMNVRNVLSGQEQDCERVVEVPGNEHGSDVAAATDKINVGE
jgi:hypothetical protein